MENEPPSWREIRGNEKLKTATQKYITNFTQVIKADQETVMENIREPFDLI